METITNTFAYSFFVLECLMSLWFLHGDYDLLIFMVYDGFTSPLTIFDLFIESQQQPKTLNQIIEKFFYVVESSHSWLGSFEVALLILHGNTQTKCFLLDDVFLWVAVRLERSIRGVVDRMWVIMNCFNRSILACLLNFIWDALDEDF